MIDKVFGKVGPTEPSITSLIVKEPIGVVAGIVPWNFPLMMAVWKMAPALAAGCSVIIKPAEDTPLTAIRVAKIAQEAGIPDGVLNVLPGYGDVGEALGRHKDVESQDSDLFIDCVKKSLKNITSWNTDSKYQQTKITSLLKDVEKFLNFINKDFNFEIEYPFNKIYQWLEENTCEECIEYIYC